MGSHVRRSGPRWPIEMTFGQTKAHLVVQNREEADEILHCLANRSEMGRIREELFAAVLRAITMDDLCVRGQTLEQASYTAAARVWIPIFFEFFNETRKLAPTKVTRLAQKFQGFLWKEYGGELTKKSFTLRDQSILLAHGLFHLNPITSGQKATRVPAEPRSDSIFKSYIAPYRKRAAGRVPSESKNWGFIGMSLDLAIEAIRKLIQ